MSNEGSDYGGDTCPIQAINSSSLSDTSLVITTALFLDNHADDVCIMIPECLRFAVKLFEKC